METRLTSKNKEASKQVLVKENNGPEEVGKAVRGGGGGELRTLEIPDPGRQRGAASPPPLPPSREQSLGLRRLLEPGREPRRSWSGGDQPPGSSRAGPGRATPPAPSATEPPRWRLSPRPAEAALGDTVEPLGVCVCVRVPRPKEAVDTSAPELGRARRLRTPPPKRTAPAAAAPARSAPRSGGMLRGDSGSLPAPTPSCEAGAPPVRRHRPPGRCRGPCPATPPGPDERRGLPGEGTGSIPAWEGRRREAALGTPRPWPACPPSPQEMPCPGRIAPPAPGAAPGPPQPASPRTEPSRRGRCLPGPAAPNTGSRQTRRNLSTIRNHSGNYIPGIRSDGCKDRKLPCLSAWNNRSCLRRPIPLSSPS